MGPLSPVHALRRFSVPCPQHRSPGVQRTGKRRQTMKRILFATAATFMMTAPLVAPAFADQPRGYGYDQRDDQRNDRRDDRTVVVVKHDRKPYRDHRWNGRWDNDRYNGYYVK